MQRTHGPIAGPERLDQERGLFRRQMPPQLLEQEVGLEVAGVPLGVSRAEAVPVEDREARPP